MSEGPVEGAGRVLVMDDEEVVRQAAAELLAACGYSVTLAADGEEAVRVYGTAMEGEEPFDAVVLDLTVPGGVGGEEAIKRLCAIDPDVRAIVSSGFSNDPVMSDFAAHGFKAMLTKPYSLPELGRRVRGVIDEDGGG